MVNTESFEKKEYTIIPYSLFDKMVNDHFENVKDFYCVANEEWDNYSCYKFDDVTQSDFVKHHYSTKWDWTRWDNFLAGNNPMYIVSSIISYFVMSGVLPEGNYLIEVFW
jgi:hypothetical protein